MLEQAIKSIECKVAYTFMSLLARLDEWHDVQQGQDVVSGGVDLFEDSGILSAEERRKRQLEPMQEGWASYIGNTRMISQVQSADGPGEGVNFIGWMGPKDVNGSLTEGFEGNKDFKMKQMIISDGVDGFGFADSGWEQDVDMPLGFGADDPMRLYHWGFEIHDTH